MASDVALAITALRHSHDRLDALVRPLTPDQLRSQSYDSEWTIAQVLSHLGSGAELGMLSLNAAIEGGESPGREAAPPIWDRWNSLTPDDQAADALEWDERHVETLEGMTPDQLARLHLSLPGMEFDAAGLIRLRLAEHAVHTWDIEVMRDPAAQVAPDAIALLLDTLTRIVTRSGKPQGRRMRVRVRTRQPERDLLLDVGESVTLCPWSGGEADAELDLPAEAFVRLVYGRLDPDHTPAGVTARGVDLEELRRTFPGF